MVEVSVPDTDDEDSGDENPKENFTQQHNSAGGVNTTTLALGNANIETKSEDCSGAGKNETTLANKTPMSAGQQSHTFLHDIKAAMSKVFDTDQVLVNGEKHTVEVFKHPSHYFQKTKKAYAAYNYLNKKANVHVDWKVFAKVARNAINNNRRKVLGTATDLDAPKVFNGKKDETGQKAKPMLPPSVKNITVTKPPKPPKLSPAGAPATALISPPLSADDTSVYQQSTQDESTESGPATAGTVAANAVKAAAKASPPKAKVRLVSVLPVS